MFLARKITKAKWGSKNGLLATEISADAITADLRTTDNELSFWKCGRGEKRQVENAALAIAAAGNRIDKFHIVWLSIKELQLDCVQYKENQEIMPGKENKKVTPIKDMVDLHVDICRLDFIRLGKVASRIRAAIENCRCLPFSRQRLMELLAAAIREDRVELSELNFKECVKEKVRKLI